LERVISVPVWWGCAALVLLVGTGCTGIPRAYPGPQRTAEEVAFVKGAYSQTFGETHYVEITSVDGEEKLDSSGSPWKAVEVLPGAHRIGAKYAKNIHQIGLFWMVKEAVDEHHNKETERVLSIEVEPGFTYGVHVALRPTRYFISRVATDRAPDRPAFNPPVDSFPCVELDSGTLDCPIR